MYKLIFALVSNTLKPQRKVVVTGLTPATPYIVKIEAHSAAGYSAEEFTFMTLLENGGTVYLIDT